MDEWLNVILRTVMCALFIFWVVRPMLMSMALKDLNMTEIDELADTVTQAAFNAWQKDNVFDPLSDPQLALYLAEHPEFQLPTAVSLEEAQAHEQALLEAGEKKDAELAADQVAANDQPAEDLTVNATEVIDAKADQPLADAQVAVVSQDGESAVTEAVPEAEEDMSDSLEEMKKRMKAEQKKAKPKIPTELLTNANSYEDKLVVVQMITDQDQNRVAMAIRNMIRTDR
ncbi:MAG: hypothetical protein RL307_488 [Pseudomonadota bacterium]|jgi:hypothetical protein